MTGGPVEVLDFALWTSEVVPYIFEQTLSPEWSTDELSNFIRWLIEGEAR